MSRIEQAEFTDAFRADAEAESAPESEPTPYAAAERAVDLIAERYEDRVPLGAGKSGEVWIGRIPGIERELAVKSIVHPDASVNSLHREFLLHDGFYGSGIAVPRPYAYLRGESASGQHVSVLLMERIHGSTLQEWVDAAKAEGEPVDGAEVERIEQELRTQITAAHEAGLYHRDLHLRNAMLDAEGRVRLIDFGDAARGIRSEEDAAYRSEVIRAGQRRTVVFPRDEQIVSTFRHELAASGLLPRTARKVA